MDVSLCLKSSRRSIERCLNVVFRPKQPAEDAPIRKGRFYNEIVFQLIKTPKRIQTDKLIKKKCGQCSHHPRSQGQRRARPASPMRSSETVLGYTNLGSIPAGGEILR